MTGTTSRPYHFLGENLKRKRMADSVEEASKTPKKTPGRPGRRDLLSTGSTLLNLACSGNPFGGFVKGKYHLLVGDSVSGKTFLSMTCFAEATINKQFKDYKLIYDNAEDGMEMDVEGLFGKAVADRLEPPGGFDGDGIPIYSSTAEDFYFHLDDLKKAGKPFLYVLDSMDGLDSEGEIKKFQQQKKAHREGKESPGSYGDGKAKINSQGLRKAKRILRDTESILIIVCQTRDNIGQFGPPKIHSGGRALRFYADIEIWSAIAGVITKTVRDKKRSIGNNIALKTKKNKLTGKLHEIKIDIYPSYGMDDIGTCVDYLLEEGWWGKKKQTIDAGEFDIKGTREKLIRIIEENEWEKELSSIVGKCWKDIEEKSTPVRKKKYC